MLSYNGNAIKGDRVELHTVVGRSESVDHQADGLGWHQRVKAASCFSLPPSAVSAPVQRHYGHAIASSRDIIGRAPAGDAIAWRLAGGTISEGSRAIPVRHRNATGYERHRLRSIMSLITRRRRGLIWPSGSAVLREMGVDSHILSDRRLPFNRPLRRGWPWICCHRHGPISKSANRHVWLLALALTWGLRVRCENALKRRGCIWR
jgi:hypothetical protein